MKYIIILFLLISLLGCQEISDSYVIDTFKGSNTLSSSWWRFGNIKPFVGKTNEYNFIRILGKASSWYVGGMGKYLGINENQYKALSLYVKGNSKLPTTIKIQLYDDDNDNSKIEQDKDFKPLYDDFFEYTLKVDWDGWQKVIISFNDFIEMNPGIGNDVLSSLTQIQLIFNADSELGNIDVCIANMEFIREEK